MLAVIEHMLAFKVEDSKIILSDDLPEGSPIEPVAPPIRYTGITLHVYSLTN
jgi:hypothetical protein